MGRGLSTLLLGVVAIGAFLSGLELMITAVALPAIVVDLADWTELRAGVLDHQRLPARVDRGHAPRRASSPTGTACGACSSWALVVFIAGSVLAGRADGLGDLIAARLVQAVGGGALVPVATAAASHLFDGAAPRRAPSARSGR